MARARFLPEKLAVIHPKYGTPKNAIILMFVIGTLAPFAGTNSTIYVGLMNIASFGLVVTWLFVSVTFIRLRDTMPEIRRPYTVPFGKVIGWISVVFCAAYLFLYTPWGPSGLLPIEWAGIAVIAVIALIVYFSYNIRGGHMEHEERKKLLIGEEE